MSQMCPLTLLLAVAVMATLQACGQAGDLYLPDEPTRAPPDPVQPVKVTPTRPEPAPIKAPAEAEAESDQKTSED